MSPPANSDRYLKAVSFRFDPAIKAKLERLAARNRRTMTGQLETLIEQADEGDKVSAS